jgi:hypothetical protein
LSTLPAVERKQIAGAVALLAHDGKLGYDRAKGFQDVEAGKEMATDSLSFASPL